MRRPHGPSELAGAAAVVAVLLAIFVPSHFSRDPWNPDEPRYGEVSREMKLTGSYILPQLNGEIYAEKPPLYFWLVNAAERPLGSFTLAARAVSALATALTALFLALLGKRLFDARTGVLAAAIFATSVLVVNLGQMGVIDTTLTCFATAATLALVRAGESFSLGAALAAGAAMALAVLAKGPVGAIEPIVAAAAIGYGRRGRAGIPLAASALGLAIAAGAGFAWLHMATIAAGPRGDWYWHRMVFDQNLGRVVESWSHSRPFWYYAPQLAWGFLPWIAFLPAAALAAWRARAADRSGAGVLLAALLLLLMFSAISGKRPGYVLPVYPALALLVARRAATLEAGLETPGALDRAGGVLVGTATLALGLGAAAFPSLAGRLPAFLGPSTAPLVSEFVAALPRWAGPLSLAIGALLAGLGLAMLGVFRPLTPRRTLALAAAAVAVGSIGLHAIIVPALDPQKSARALGERIARDLPSSGDRLVFYLNELDGVVNFRTGALHYDVIETEDALRAALPLPGGLRPPATEPRAPGRLWVVMEDKFFDGLAAGVRARLAVRGAYRVGSRVIYVLVETSGLEAS